MRWTMLWGVLLLSVHLVLPATAADDAGSAGSDWRAEFEAVCSQTDAAMGLADEELGRLIARCDKLAELIGAETEVIRRVFLKRLQRCRDLFVFVLDSRKAPPAAGQGTPPPNEAPPASP